MPTRTRSPSGLAHSCSRVYLRSWGTLAIISSCRRRASAGLRRSTFGLSTLLLHPGRVERCADDLGRLRLPADLHLERRADGRVGRLHVRHRDVLVDRGTVRARGDDPGRPAVFQHGVAVTRDGLVDHLDADQPPPHALGADLLERLAADEVALGGLDDPAEPRFERVGGVVEVVAVERVLHLEPQRVARAEPDRRDAVGAARLDERLPEMPRPIRGHVQLEAVLARVARARDQRRHPGDGAPREAVIADRRHVAVGEPADERLGLRALHRDEPRALGRVAPARVLDVLRGLRHMSPVLVDVPGVDGEHVAVVAHAVHGEVVDDRAGRVAEDRVLDLAHLESRDVVGGQMLERGEGARALDLELAHVADVEESNTVADRSVLLDDPGVLHRHLPSTERHHARAGRDVLVIERRALEGRAVHAFGNQSRSGLTWHPARSSASRTVRTIRCAPGVSPWQQMVWTEMSISTPSIVRTLPSMAIFTAWAAARSGSVMSEPGSLRETSVRSTLYARSANPSDATRTPILRAVRSYLPDARAMRIRSRPGARAASATAAASGSSFSIME